MEGINLVGNLLGSSGYEVHTRNLLNSLMKFIKVKLITQIPAGAETQLTDKELNAIKNNEVYDTSLIITHPVHWRMHTTNKKNIVYCVWEGDRVPKSFINEILNPEIDYVIVPSKHTYDAILNTASKDYTLLFKRPEEHNKELELLNKIKIINHGINLDLFYPTEKPKDKFRFLMNKGFRHLEDRGGIQYGILAYLQEFTKEDNVELLIKINPSYGIPDINKLIEPWIKEYPNHAPIQFFIQNVKYEDLVKIYNNANCFISPTRCEGFNLPCLEAMACGLPVITTNFGGQLDFCNNDNSWIVSGEMTEVRWELQYENINWLTPDIKQLRDCMREAYYSNNILQEKSIEALKTAKQLTWDKTANSIISLI